MAKVTIDGKDFDTETLSAEAKDHIANISVCDQQIQRLKREIAITQTARNAYAAALKNGLPKDA